MSVAAVLTVCICANAASAPRVEPRGTNAPELVSFVAADQKISRSAANARLQRLAAANAVVQELRDTRPSWFAGAWVDPAKLRQVIGVVGDGGRFSAGLHLTGKAEAADIDLAVREVPATAVERVRQALLRRARELKRRAPRVLAWVDEDAGALRITLAGSSPGAIADRLASAAAGSGLKVIVDRSEPPRFRAHECSFPNCDRPLRTGTGVGLNGGSNCSAGFFARSTKYRYLVTAGHCRTRADKGVTWYAKSPTYYNHDTGNRSWPIGKNLTSLTSYGPYDYMAVRIDKGSFWWAKDPGGYYDDRRNNDNLGSYWSTRMPQVGEPSCRYGISSNYGCGYVLATNLTTYVSDVAVSGLFSTSSCSTPGDSGGPFLASGGVLLGLLSGGIGSCGETPGDPSSGYSVASQAATVLSQTGLGLLAGD